MKTVGPTTGIDVQDRDRQVLRGLFESRAMTLGHVASLYFSGKGEAAKKRLQKLKRAGFVRERPRRPSEPSVLHLTRRGHALLMGEGCLVDYPSIQWADQEKRTRVSDLTLRHELAVMDVKVAFVKALAARADVHLAEFSTWPALYQFKACPDPASPEMLVKPDGFIRLHHTSADGAVWEHAFFLEVDRSTETLNTLTQKAACYLDFYQSGGLAQRNGRPRSEYKDFRFRVLMVFRTSERRDNVAKRLLTAPPGTRAQVWLSTLGEVSEKPLGPIWVRPADCRTGNATLDMQRQAHSASLGMVPKRMIIEASPSNLLVEDKKKATR